MITLTGSRTFAEAQIDAYKAALDEGSRLAQLYVSLGDLQVVYEHGHALNIEARAQEKKRDECTCNIAAGRADGFLAYIVGRLFSLMPRSAAVSAKTIEADA